MITVPLQSDFSTGEIHKLCGVTHRRVQYWVDHGLLDGNVDEFGYRLIPREALLEFLARRGREVTALTENEPPTDFNPFVLKRAPLQVHVWRLGKLDLLAAIPARSFCGKLIDFREPLREVERLPLTPQIQSVLDRGVLDGAGLREISGYLRPLGISGVKLARTAGYKHGQLSMSITGYCRVTPTFEIGVRRAFGLAPRGPKGGAE